MNKWSQVILMFLVLVVVSPVVAQPHELSPTAKMSLLTASPGQELYSVFGHSALRVYDPVSGIDEVYNYGTFDFNTPFFYYKFVRGQLLYQLSVSTFDRFLWEYHYEGRGMYEQTLNLSPEQMQKVYDFLLINRLPQNRSYKYDFFYDNCSTRIRDLIDELVEPDWGGDPFPMEKRTFRDMLKPYLEPLPWSRFGVDLALGLPSDIVASPWNYMFLPDELFIAFAQARLADGSPLVGEHEVVLEQKIELSGSGESLPAITFWVLLVLGVLTLWKQKWSLWFDRIFFFALGLIGLVLFFLWFLSEHHATNNNMNLLWALPTHLYFVFKIGMNKTAGITKTYFLLIGLFNATLLVFWLWLPQDFHAAFFPIILLAAIKSLNYGFNIRNKFLKDY